MPARQMRIALELVAANQKFLMKEWRKILNAEFARRIGSAKSEKKKAASRANGKLGGRPKKGENKTAA